MNFDYNNNILCLFGKKCGDKKSYNFVFEMPSLYETISFASNAFDMINGIKVAKYLTHVHGNAPSVNWFLDNLSKHGKIPRYLGYVSAIVDDLSVFHETGDLGKVILTRFYDIDAMHVVNMLSGFVGGLIGGPVGAIVGVVVGIIVEEVFNTLKKMLWNF